ncbi:unnamed protein product, partial [Symbiodinium sp. CCMP2592]
SRKRAWVVVPTISPDVKKNFMKKKKLMGKLVALAAWIPDILLYHAMSNLTSLFGHPGTLMLLHEFSPFMEHFVAVRSDFSGLKAFSEKEWQAMAPTCGYAAFPQANNEAGINWLEELRSRKDQETVTFYPTVAEAICWRFRDST